MSATKILIVDDSVVFRKALGDTLSSVDGFEVVGQSSNGKLALEKIASLEPDIVILDVEMPVMDGIEALKQIRGKHPTVSAVMFSSHTTKSAAMTIEALTLGAKGFVAKPSSASLEANLEVIENELIPLLRNLGNASDLKKKRLTGRMKRDTAKLMNRKRVAIAIGVSTGGPNALQSVLPELPEDLEVPVFLVQHMPPIFTKQLAERLDRASKVSVVEAEDGMKPAKGTVYIAPGDFHMVVERDDAKQPVIRLNQAPKENGCRPAVDPLFRSLAQVYGADVVSCVMTGMGSDGALGAQAISDAGGIVVAQDMETSTIWGMPGAVVASGLDDRVLPLEMIGRELVRLMRG